MHKKMDDLAKKIQNDALKSGYPSELKAERIFTEAAWPTTGNSYFIDQDENKGREIDLHAYKNSSDTGTNPVVFAWSMISADVKKSEKPWVVFSSKRCWRENNPGYSLLSHLHNTQGHINHEILNYEHPTTSLPRIGRSSQVAFSHDTSTIFNSIVSAVKASIEEHRAAEEHKEIWSENSVDAVFYEPVVILDGKLFECYLDENNEIKTEEAGFLQYGLHYASPRYKAKQYFVDIVTLGALEEYLVLKEAWLKRMYDYIFQSAYQNGVCKNT